MLKRALILASLISCLAAQNTSPERKVQGNVLTSDHDPKVRIQLPQSVRYIGADRWVLYGMADCELHAFVEANAQKDVQQLYWIQFESYLSTRPELHHTYDSPRHLTIGGMDFYVDTWVQPPDATSSPGSDLEHIQKLVGDMGYRMQAGMTVVRLVHLLDEQKRKELMIIYGETLAGTGFSAADLQKGGKANQQWPAIQDALIQRAQARMSVQSAEGR